MTRYFFHLVRNETLIEDYEGDELGGLEAAKAEAIRAAQELVVSSVRTGQPIDGDRVEIWTETEGRIGEVRLVDVIPFKDKRPGGR